MSLDKLNDAMDRVRDSYLTEAIQTKKKSRLPWLGAVAAMLALGILIHMLIPSQTADGPSLEAPVTEPVQTEPTTPRIPADPAEPLELTGTQLCYSDLSGLVVSPDYPGMVPYPQDIHSSAEYDAWYQNQREQYDQPAAYDASLKDFWSRCIPLLLCDEAENTVCSPVNIYSALAMLAQCTDGNSRQQILDLLGQDSIEALRTQASHVWNAHYRSDGLATCILGSSLWIDEDITFNSDTLDILAKDFYATVFQGDLGTPEMNSSLHSWLNRQTGNLLQEYVNGIELPEDSAMALASTIFYQAAWSIGFSQSHTVTDIFHGPQGDISWAFMQQTIRHSAYYQGADYGAVALPLQDGSRMWLVLPSEGKTPADILRSGNAVTMILQDTNRSTVKATIELSLPRFDVSSQTDLTPVLEKLGITDVFSNVTADFSAVIPDREDIYLGKADHAARVVIDEEGVTGAAYTIMYIYATGAFTEPEQVVEFTLDRPFLFLIESQDGLPLFAGVVNQP